MTDHRTRILHDEVRECAASRRAPLRTIVVVGLLFAAVLSVAHAASPPTAPTPGKPGGILNLLQREELTTGFSIHETATIATVWPASPCYSNLVIFDPFKPRETLDGIVGELAEKWSWQDNYRNLVFFLRKGVKWHDGQPFTSKDVKFTFDMVREAPEATGKLRVNPRKDWYGNVEAIEAPDAHTVVFHLKRPQPSLLLMLASGDSPVYPAHVPPAEQRVRCVGTGPFKLKEWKRGEYVDYVRNPDYFVKGRPYLDGIRYLIVNERGTRTAALQAGRADAASPLDSSPQIAAQLKAAVPGMVITRVGAGNADNLLLNITKPPFNDARVRKALSRAVDRQAEEADGNPSPDLVRDLDAAWAELSPAEVAWLRARPPAGEPNEDGARARKVRARQIETVEVFVMPPSFAVLEQRLRGRSKDSEDAIQRRLQVARDEVAAFAEYDFVIVNDELTAAVDGLRGIVIAERARLERMHAGAEAIVRTFS
jgi:hypothetical protein